MSGTGHAYDGVGGVAFRTVIPAGTRLRRHRPNTIGQTIGNMVADRIEMAELRAQIPGANGHSDDEVRTLAGHLSTFDEINGDTSGTALGRMASSQANTDLMWKLVQAQQATSFEAQAAIWGGGSEVSQAGSTETVVVTPSVLSLAEQAFVDVGGATPEHAQEAVNAIRSNMDAAAAAGHPSSPAFGSFAVDDFVIGAGHTIASTMDAIDSRPWLKWSLEGLAFAAGPANYAIGQVVGAVTAPAIGAIGEAIAKYGMSVGYGTNDAIALATGVIGIGALGLGLATGGISAVKNLFNAGKNAIRNIASSLKNLEITIDRNVMSMNGLGGIRIVKAINLPSWKTIGIDLDHIVSGHTVGGDRVSPLKDLFPETMSPQNIEDDVRNAYRYGSKIRTQGDNVLVRGPSSTKGMQIEMWVNTRNKVITTAYPWWR